MTTTEHVPSDLREFLAQQIRGTFRNGATTLCTVTGIYEFVDSVLAAGVFQESAAHPAEPVPDLAAALRATVDEAKARRLSSTGPAPDGESPVPIDSLVLAYVERMAGGSRQVLADNLREFAAKVALRSPVGVEITDEAVEAAERETESWPEDAGLPWLPEGGRESAIRGLLRAARPFMTSHPALDTESLYHALVEVSEREDFGKFLEDDDFTALHRAVMALAVPVPTQEQIEKALSHARDEGGAFVLDGAHVYDGVQRDLATAVLALLNGSAK